MDALRPRLRAPIAQIQQKKEIQSMFSLLVSIRVAPKHPVFVCRQTSSNHMTDIQIQGDIIILNESCTLRRCSNMLLKSKHKAKQNALSEAEISSLKATNKLMSGSISQTYNCYISTPIRQIPDKTYLIEYKIKRNMIRLLFQPHTPISPLLYNMSCIPGYSLPA